MKILKLTSLIGVLLFLACHKPKTETTEIEETPLKEVVEERPNQKLTIEQQIMSAILAAPAEVREGAKVYGYDSEGNFTTLRVGTNEMICIADDPNKEGFQVVAYHKELEPYMARGRALKAQGIGFPEHRDMREKEADEGKLQMPKNAATLHILSGKNAWFDTKSSEVRNASYRYVVYIPYATQESTGLSLEANAPGHPWLMFPGRANAHIMITPPIEADQ
ncbi:MAG: hypothetical protein QNJ57_11495 [Flavobacteriaceae bacterium]|nr:hypothetical protein [Flavobacteriaceae bacterium]